MNWLSSLVLGLSLLAAQPVLQPHQEWAIQQGYKAAAAYDTDKALEFTFVETFQAILGQESSYCYDKHKRDPLSWGCGQLTVKTARLFDKNATAKRLMRDDRYNIWLAATYLAYCRDHTRDWTGMVRCYHGWNSDDWPTYVQMIRKRLQELHVSED